MKKSKFLKKSLAMLLAVMLVVAMIPLSAAAASPNFQAAYAAATGETQGRLDQEGNTLTGSYRRGAASVDLTVIVGEDNLVYYTEKSTAATTDKQVPVTGNKAAITGLDTKLYANADGNVEIQFSVADASAASVRDNYTVVLKPVDANTETEITDFELNRVTGNTIPNWEEASIGVDFVSVTMPYDSQGSRYVIRNMSVSEGATWTITGSANYSGDDTGIVNGAPEVEVKDGDVITISNGGRKQQYTLHINIADGFTSFDTAEGLDAAMFTDSGDIVVLLPFGTAEDAEGAEIDVTPIFDLDYPGATAYWGDKEINGVDDTITLDSDIIVDTEGFTSTYHCFEGTESTADWTYRKNDKVNYGAFSQFASAGIKQAVQKAYREQLTIVYADESERTYNVYFCETEVNNEAAIESLVIGSEQATINEENKTIDITLPNGTNLAALDLSSDSATTAMTMTASYGADIEFVQVGGNTSLTSAGDRSATQTYTYTGTETIDAREPISVVVRSQDNPHHTETEEFYTLNVNASSDYATAEITSFTISNGDYKYTASMENGGIDKNGNVTLKVPYAIYDRDLLNGSWKFYYTKGIGTLATVNGTALPVTGSTIDLTNPVFAAMLPEVGDKSVGDPIAVRMVGEDLTQNSQQYLITIERQDPQTASTLEKFTLVGDETMEVPGVSHEYQGTVDNSTVATNHKGAIKANVSWTANQYWNADQMEVIAEVAANSNARVFYLNQYGDYVELLNSGDEDNTSVSKTNISAVTANTGDGQVLYNNNTLYVLSEQAWVNLVTRMTRDTSGVMYFDASSANDLPTLLNQTNTGNYTQYTLTMGANSAEEGAALQTMTLVDGTGWEADLEINIRTNSLENLTVPYALTSDLDEDGELNPNGVNTSVNPIFLTYDFDDANRAYVLGSDVNIDAGKAVNTLDDPANVPTAGVTTTNPAVAKGNAVFYDMAAYTGEWTEDKYEDYVAEGKPFLLISREGDMYVYNWQDADNDDVVEISEFKRNTNVKANSLTISSENGNANTVQVFDVKMVPTEPNAGTDFASFYFTGYERFPATVDAANHTISVVLPFGTEYTYLIPNFELTADSQGAIITVDDPDLLGKPVRKGVTNVNFTSTRKFTVIAENETTRAEWTVNVSVADEFSDVTTKDWFYNDVMAAAGFGYVNGMGNGKYEPYGTTTRAQFAKILAEALDYDPTAYTTSAFPDVANDHWAMAAIAFCADQEIILGYDTGNFEPGKTITRQEAALMLQRAFDLVGTESTQYPDDASIAGWAEDGVYAVKHAGLMKGDADTGNFRPTSTLNRAEMATILMNAHRAGLIK